ncbi:ABC transporter permease [Luteimicrobium subarcticum]|uniref:ABC-2 type transporter transmembrane domain-containing protein n=1 Tax=Luteimicrobium subarcticum TaxID=620910 RepID=A0A2M8WUR3_9MICO|nr:ABC transporter permease [Luteimicrobium subarcticum]PJI94672.1 hypothetical protein CLV34_0517 [Luteimicrobium subarcticum]
MSTTTWRKAIGLGGALALLVTLLVTAFAYPAARAGAHDVPLALVAPDTSAAQVERALDTRAPGAFDVTRYADEDAARAAVADHDVDGALVLAQDGVRLDVASAASPAVAQLLEQAATGTATAAAQAAGRDVPAPVVTVTDVVPSPADDARGAVLAAGVLPAVMGSMATGILASLVVRGRTRRLAAIGVASVAAGLLVGAVLGPWLGALPGSYAAVAGIVALGTAAGALVVAGLGSVLGRAGLVVGGVLVMLMGNPSSAAASAPELLPGAWGAVGPWLPAGAMVSALREVTFFGGAHAAAPLLTLAAWVVVLGAALLLGRAGRGATGASDAERAEEEEASGAGEAHGHRLLPTPA